MKNIQSYFKCFLASAAMWLLSGCVHDDKYDAPDSASYQCAELKATMTLEQAKALYKKNAAYVFPADSKDVIEGYVSSSDETGNIYKTIFIQDKPENPTQGFTIVVDAVSTYTKYPQGSKVYVKLAGLALGEYNGLVQLGVRLGTETRATDVSRIAEKSLPSTVYRSCSARMTIVPKVMTLDEMGAAKDQYLGALIKVQKAEFDQKILCTQYAPDGQSVDRQINDATKSVTTRVVRSSGYASFANKTIPSGNGDVVGILSKFGSTYQIYINREADLNMTGFPRLDGIKEAPCAPASDAKAITVAEAKKLLAGSLTQISANLKVTAKVTANDETGNLFKYFYMEDATGGIRVNVNMTGLYQDRRFQVGKMVTVSLKDLYIGDVDGELQLGGLYGGKVGQVEPAQIYSHFFGTDQPISTVTATERRISELSKEDVGRWVKIKDLQFISSDLFKPYAEGTYNTNRTLEDCSGNKITLRTSGRADFGNRDFPMPSTKTEVDTGKGDVYAIVSYYNGSYQLWITKLRDADLDNPRCDGTLPPKTNAVSLFQDPFDTLGNWTAVNIAGPQVWASAAFGNPKPCARIDGASAANEDWLVLAKPVSLAGYTDAFLSFDSDGRYNGNKLEVYAAEAYNGTATSWTKLDAAVDTNMDTFVFANSGSVSLKKFAGKTVVIGFKYTSTAAASSVWEVDNVVIKGSK